MRTHHLQEHGQHRRRIAAPVEAAQLQVLEVAAAQGHEHHARQAQAGGRSGGDGQPEATGHQGHGRHHVLDVLLDRQPHAFLAEGLGHFLRQPVDGLVGVEDHGQPVEVGHPDLPALRQRVRFVHRHQQRLAQHRLDHQVRLGRDQAVEAHADAPFAQRLQLLGLGEVVQRDAHLRPLRVEFREHTGNDVQHARAVDAHVELSGQPLRRAPRALGRALRQVQQVGHLVQQRLARLGQLHTGRRAQEQRRTHLVFQRLDLARQRRLRHVQALGRAGEVALFGDRQKLAHVFEIHGASWFGSQYLTSIGSQKFGIGRYDRSALSLAAEAAALKKN